MSKMITQAFVKTVLDFDPDTGIFIWKQPTCRHISVGSQAGTLNDNGYIKMCILGQRYAGHRLAWFWMHGEFPSGDIDHINRIRHDNRIANLRIAARTLNIANSSLRSDNKSGHRGVLWHKRDKIWNASIGFNGKRIMLGSFIEKSDAISAYRMAADKYFGEFANYGNDA